MNGYERQGSDYPTYPGNSLGQVVRRDGYTVKDQIWFPIFDKKTGTKKFLPKVVDKMVIIEFTWYGRDTGWKRREVLPPMNNEKMEQKAQLKKKTNIKVTQETEEERTKRILQNMGYRF